MMSYGLEECGGDIAGDAEWQFWCRLCSKDDVRNINILPEGSQTPATNPSSSLSDFIAEFFKIQIEEDAELPHWLCGQCFSLITSLSKYTIQVKKVQNMYNEIQKATDRKSLNLREFREKYNLLDEDLFIFSLLDVKYSIENIFVHDVEETTEKTLATAIKDEILTDEVQNGIFFESLEFKREFQDPIGDIDENQCSEDDSINSGHIDKNLDTKSEEYEEANGDVREEKYFCKDCSMYFPQSVDYHQHMEQKHSLFTCPQCSKKFKTTTHLNLHLRSHAAKYQKNKSLNRTERATKESNYTCSDCSMDFQRRGNYYLHMKKIHGVVKNDEPHLSCPQCGRTFTNSFNLNRHIKTHRPLAEKRIFPCPQCERKFETKDYVARHIKFVHENIREFICEECGEGVRTETTLREHMLTHTNDTPFICEVCEKGFKCKSRLKKHLEIHSSDKHNCSECGLQLNSRVTLNRHMLVHSDVMSHKCDYCGRKFKRAKTLKAHLILHSGIRPYSCDFCDRTFASGSNCRTHKKRSHPEEFAAQEASGEKQFTKNIPKLAVLKTVTRSAENLLPVVSKQSGNFSFGKKPKPRPPAELQPQVELQHPLQHQLELQP